MQEGIVYRSVKVNKRLLWMERKKQLSLSNTLSHHLHLQEATTPPPQLDRISYLPDDILHCILSLMPMQMSIRTSILSKRWRHLWKYTHIVDFHMLPCTTRKLLYWDCKKIDCTPISHCLDLLESPVIQSFTVVGHFGHSYYNEVGKWVDFALSKNVPVLRIGLMPISYSMIFFLLPKSLFTENDQTRKLKVLVLDRCVGLANVNISGPNLKLKHLVFKWYGCDDGKLCLLKVDAPGLLTLTYSGGLTKICLKNCQGLLQVVLLGEKEQINEANMDHIRDLMNQVTQVKTLGVNFQFLQFVAKAYYTRGSPFLKFQNLEYLCWYGSLGSQNDVYNLVAFLGDCPSLEDCVIDFREENWPAFCYTFWEPVEEPKFVMIEDAQDQLYHGRCLKKLKSVKVICFSGFVGEMMLVKLLLEKAVNLQILELLLRNDLSSMTDNVLQIVYTLDRGSDLVANLQEYSIKEKVTRLPKASPNAEVQFSRGWESCEWYKTFEVPNSYVHKT
ncbi:hypothetical protein CRYUN_Cryun07bG0171300 [Craigia yunnanensis]